jgi:prepilin-type N-terminal cleavage/methylation domain-containing protein
MTGGHHRNDRSRPDSFTLVELLIVIVILGILATVTVFAVRGITDKGQSSSEATDLRMLETANEAYWLEYGTNATEQELVDNGFLKEQSALFDLAVDSNGVLTITNVRTGQVASTSAADSGSTSGGGGGGGGSVGSVTGIVKNATNEALISGVSVCVLHRRRAGGATDDRLHHHRLHLTRRNRHHHGGRSDHAKHCVVAATCCR